MNLDDLHDALNLLDDDMVESVERLRSRKRKRRWIRFLSMAACLCMGVMGLYAAGRLLTPARDGATECVGSKENEMFLGNQYGIEDGAASGEGTTEGTASILIEIKTLKADGFTGEVTDPMESEELIQGDVLTVVLADDLEPDSITDLQEGDWVMVIYFPNQSQQNKITAHEITLVESGQ